MIGPVGLPGGGPCFLVSVPCTLQMGRRRPDQLFKCHLTLLPFLCPPASSIFTPALQLNFGLRLRRMRLCQYSPVTISVWDGSIMCYRLLSHEDPSLFLSHSLYYFGLIYTHTHTHTPATTAAAATLLYVAGIRGLDRWDVAHFLIGIALQR